MYPPTPPAISIMPMNHPLAPNLRAGAGGSTLRINTDERSSDSVVAKSFVNAPGWPGSRHGGSVLNPGAGGKPGDARFSGRTGLGANTPGPDSRGSRSEL